MRRTWLVLALVATLSPAASARQTLAPTPPPLVTAEREPWFLEGGPITYEGGIYVASGARIHFVANEMVRSGSYRGIPLYQRTTLEPYSVVFVALPGGLMQPYERRRTGELAGTVGSVTPGFPIGPSTGPGSASLTGIIGAPQAAGPPLTVPFAIETAPPVQPGAAPASPVATAEPAPPAQRSAAPGNPVGTSGRAPARVARRTEGRNGMFVEFENARWFNRGPATLVDTSRYVHVGEYRGVPVYRDPRGSAAIIYIPLMRDAPALAAPFERQRN